jgi:glycosyltransferase involved in cell wall biosynthesis
LYYHGTLVPPRLPLIVLDALAAVPESVTLTVVGYETIGALGYADELRHAAQRVGLVHRVRILPPMPRHELLPFCASHDVGIALMPIDTDDINLHEMVGASNKALDYLACGLALLVSDLPSWTSAYVDSGLARGCCPGDPASIATAIRWFLDHPSERHAMAMRGRQRILAEWTYEREFEPVRDLMDGGPARYT